MLDAVGRSATAILLLAVLIAQLLCGLACIESSSRVLFAVSRDRILPGSAFWYRVSRRTRTPVNSVWLTAAGAALLATPELWDTATFGTLAALAALASGLAAIVPIHLRLRRREFVPGRWQLGRWSTLTGLVAVGWTALVSLALMAPRVPSITRDRFDYLPVVLALVFILARIHWSSTAHGTRTPPRRGRPDEPGALDAELA